MSDPIGIVSAARTPIGGMLGDFASLQAPQLDAVCICAAMERAGIAGAAVDGCIPGQIDADSSTLVHDFPFLIPVDDPRSRSWHFGAVRLRGRFRTGKSFVFHRGDVQRPASPAVGRPS